MRRERFLRFVIFYFSLVYFLSESLCYYELIVLNRAYVWVRGEAKLIFYRAYFL